MKTAIRKKTNDYGQITRFLHMAKEKNLTCDDLKLILSTVELTPDEDPLKIKKLMRSVDRLFCKSESGCGDA